MDLIIYFICFSDRILLGGNGEVKNLEEDICVRKNFGNKNARWDLRLL